MRRCGFSLLLLWKRFNIFLLWLRGLTPEDEASRRIVSGEVWNEFCDTIKAAGASLLTGDPPIDGFNQAEGYRYLSRLVRVGLENFVECSDVRAPHIVALAHGLRPAPVKIGSDNPDNLYENAILNSDLVYYVTGTRGGVHYLGFGVQAGSYGKPGGLLTVDYKEAKEMGFSLDENNPNKEISFYVSTLKNKPNECKRNRNPVPHLCMVEDPKQHVLIVRQTYNDRMNDIPAKLSITLHGEDAVPSALTPEKLEDALQTAGLFVAGASMMFSIWAKDFKKHVNQLPLFDQEKSNKAGGDPNIRYYHSYWSLGPDEALVIEATPPKCEAWNFQLNNHWMESLDYRYYNIHINGYLATYRPDDTVCVIVAHRNPGLANTNWINTVEHNCGTMCWRWIKPEDDIYTPPVPRVVNLNDYIEECTSGTTSNSNNKKNKTSSVRRRSTGKKKGKRGKTPTKKRK